MLCTELYSNISLEVLLWGMELSYAVQLERTIIKSNEWLRYLISLIFWNNKIRPLRVLLVVLVRHSPHKISQLYRKNQLLNVCTSWDSTITHKGGATVYIIFHFGGPPIPSLIEHIPLQLSWKGQVPICNFSLQFCILNSFCVRRLQAVHKLLHVILVLP